MLLLTWQRDEAGHIGGRACTNRPRLCPGDEVDACGLRLRRTWRGLSPLFPCEGDHIHTGTCKVHGRNAWQVSREGAVLLGMSMSMLHGLKQVHAATFGRNRRAQRSECCNELYSPASTFRRVFGPSLRHGYPGAGAVACLRGVQGASGGFRGRVEFRPLRRVGGRTGWRDSTTTMRAPSLSSTTVCVYDASAQICCASFVPCKPQARTRARRCRRNCTRMPKAKSVGSHVPTDMSIMIS